VIVEFYNPSKAIDMISAWGGHSLMKFKTMCVQTLLSLCYMLRIIQNFMNLFLDL
jgi:hypothetical protein